MDSSTQKDLSRARSLEGGTQSPQPVPSSTDQKLQMLYMTLSEVWYSMSWSDIPVGVQYTVYALVTLVVIFLARKLIQKAASMVHGMVQGIRQSIGMVQGIRRASDGRGIHGMPGIQDIVTMLEKMQQTMEGQGQGLETLAFGDA